MLCDWLSSFAVLPGKEAMKPVRFGEWVDPRILHYCEIWIWHCGSYWFVSQEILDRRLLKKSRHISNIFENTSRHVLWFQLRNRPWQRSTLPECISSWICCKVLVESRPWSIHSTLICCHGNPYTHDSILRHGICVLKIKIWSIQHRWCSRLTESRWQKQSHMYSPSLLYYS